MNIRCFDKILFFIKRYWLAELISAIASYTFALTSILVYNDKIISSYNGSIGAFIGFYLIIYINDLKIYKSGNNFDGFKNFWNINSALVKNLLIEFGISELIDILASRPFCLYISQIYISNFTLAVIVGSIIANILFFGISGFMFAKKTNYQKIFKVFH